MQILKKYSYLLPSFLLTPHSTQKIGKNGGVLQSLRPCIVLAQIFGIFPVEGVTENDPRKLRFRWTSWKVIYSFFVTCGLSFFVVIKIIIIFRTELSLGNITSLLFYGFAFLESIFFIQLATMWPKLMRHWSYVDEKMKNYGYPKKLERRLKITTSIFLTVAFIEYCLALGNNAIHEEQEEYAYKKLEAFAKIQFTNVFNVVEFAAWKFFILMIINTIGTFLWNFTDLFVMLCSSVLAARFKQITRRLEKFDYKDKSEFFWRNVREDFDRLTHLCSHLDKTISNILLLSYICNLSFIIFQLFHSIRKLFNPLEKTYFYFSFIFLIARTIALSLYGASINDESKEPITILNSVPSAFYNTEVKRFLLHLKIDSVALTGHKLFKLTRGFILNIAATIVTYELVLIQFNQATLRTLDDYNITLIDDRTT